MENLFGLEMAILQNMPEERARPLQIAELGREIERLPRIAEGIHEVSDMSFFQIHVGRVDDVLPTGERELKELQARASRLKKALFRSNFKFKQRLRLSIGQIQNFAQSDVDLSDSDVFAISEVAVLSAALILGRLPVDDKLRLAMFRTDALEVFLHDDEDVRRLPERAHEESVEDVETHDANVRIRDLASDVFELVVL